jgi:ASC-1-like (ASCH) protein
VVREDRSTAILQFGAPEVKKGEQLVTAILHLTLKKKWFDLMISGRKKIEYRKPSRWIMSRLSKDYDVIKFTNGYGSTKPFFICEYKGFEISDRSETINIDGNNIDVEIGTAIIKLGQIIERGNL